MSSSDLTQDEMRRRAADIGLTRLTEEHLQQLLRAAQTAQARRSALPIDTLTPADEPAHVFSLTGGDPT